MISRLVTKPHCLVLAQLLCTLFLSQPSCSQLESEDQSNSFEDVSRGHVFSTSGEDDANNGDDYPEGIRTRDYIPTREMDYQTKRAWGKNSMNVWGKRNQMNKLGRWNSGDIEAMVGRMDGRPVDGVPQEDLVKPPTHRDPSETRGLRVAKRGWTPKHRDDRWSEYNYLHRAKMAPQWGRNNMHVWG